MRARDLALRVYEQRRQEALERGDMEALDTLERNYECVRFVWDFLAWLCGASCIAMLV